ncbi:MAG: hypothetical protein AMXMBFR84_29570 [Candidatus Hydrogenedentota bacterium]
MKSVSMSLAFAAACSFLALGALAEEPAAKRVKADANGDGQITFQELQAARPQVTQEEFDKRDINDDGVLTDADKLTNKSATMKEDAPAADSGERGRQRRGEPGQIFARADADKDGKVTLGEIQAIAPNFPEERFKLMDKNGDGHVERGEILQGPAQGEGQGPGMLFARADADKDGRITMDEVAAIDANFPKERFQQMDSNADGAVTQDELRKFAGRRFEIMRKADTNGDRRISMEEMKTADPNFTQEQFARMDVNGDGMLTEEDRRSAVPNRQAQARNMQAGMAPEADTKYSMIASLMSADSNQDGSVTFDEVAAAKPGLPREVFDRYDTNKDGVVTPADR